jgi:hypothetical protein
VVGSWVGALDALTARAPTVEVEELRRPDAGRLARCSAAVWDHAADLDHRGPPRRLVEAALAGVPVVMTRTSAHVAGGVADPDLVVDTPAGWTDALLALVSDERWRAARSVRAQQAGAALVGYDARLGAVRRLLGWLTTEAET